MLDDAIVIGSSLAEDRRVGQGGLFDGEESNLATTLPAWNLPKVKPFTKTQKLTKEKEVLGIHISGHPLDESSLYIESWCSHSTKTAQQAPEGREIVVGGIISSVGSTLVKSGRSAGKPMAMLTI